MLLVYTLSAWFLFLGVSNLAWFGFISIFFADIFHLIFVLRYHISENAKKKKTLEGAIAHGVKKTIPVSLLTIILLIVLDVTFYFLKLPMLISGSLPQSFAICVCYVLWMPFFAAALLSFCPLENTCEKIKRKSK
jgi:predicted RND superfamily exporter protein